MLYRRDQNDGDRQASMLRAAISIVLRIRPIELGSDSIDLLDVAVCSFGIAHRTRVRHPRRYDARDLAAPGRSGALPELHSRPSGPYYAENRHHDAHQTRGGDRTLGFCGPAKGGGTD